MTSFQDVLQATEARWASRQERAAESLLRGEVSSTHALQVREDDSPDAIRGRRKALGAPDPLEAADGCEGADPFNLDTLERIINNDEKLSAAFFLRAAALVRCVGRIEVRASSGLSLIHI